MPFEAGEGIRLRNDPGRVGTVTGRTRSRGDVDFYQIRFPDGMSFQPEYELEPLDEAATDPLELLRAGRFGGVSDIRRNLSHIQLSGRLANLVYSMETTNTDFYAYQYKPVLSFLESPSNGILIADEVGLGKTIEAGLIWTELRARLDARRLVVVCPAMLREKWCDELRDRFGIEAQVVNANDLVHELNRPRHDVPDGRAFVCSMQGLRPPRGWDVDESVASNPRTKLARLLDSAADDEPIIDLLIVDEAHYMRNPKSQTARMGRLVRGAADAVVLLSATPINLHEEDLFHLLNLVDPESFDRKDIFPAVVRANEPLQRARQFALNVNIEWDEIRDELLKAQDHSLLKGNRQLRELLTNSGGEKSIATREKRVELADRIEKINLLRNAVTRTRKAEVTEWRVVRRPQTTFVELSEAERSFYNYVTREIRNYAESSEVNSGFLLASPQRQVSSCMFAAYEAWVARGEDPDNTLLYEDLGHDPTDTDDGAPLIAHIRSTVIPHIDPQELRDNDTKYSKFAALILDYLRENQGEKIIAFSYFRRTLDYLASRLRDEGVGCVVLKGGMGVSKQDVIQKFRDSKDDQVLLSSEVASEGVDLQFCSFLINYDLPWNPMKVEQRIGRIDRLGQKAPVISIANICCEDTIDHRIHDRLYQRLGIFERALGGLETILGEQIADLTSNLLSKNLTPEEENQCIEQTAMAIEKIRIQREELEDEASSLIAHGGYILENVRAAHEFGRRITDRDLMVYVKEYLERNHEGYEFRQKSSDDLTFEIRLPPKLASELGEYVQDMRLSGLTKLPSGEMQNCRFKNKIERKGIVPEVISQFHPFVRYIHRDLSVAGGAFYPLAAIRVASNGSDDVPEGIYGYAVDRWSFTGLRVEEELRAAVMSFSNGKRLKTDEALRLVNYAKLEGSDWLAAKNEVDIDQAWDAINESIDSNIGDFQMQLATKRAENDDRVTFQVESAKRHHDKQLRSRNEALAKLRAQKNQRLIPAMEAQIRKIGERFDVRVETLKKKGQMTASRDEICAGVIEVVRLPQGQES